MTTETTTIALIGLGRIGRELVTHLIAAGHDIRVYNRTATAAQEAANRGARSVDTVAEAVSSADVVITVLFGPDTVRDLIVTPEVRFRRGALWIDVTTIAPRDAQEFSGWAAGHGIRYVHSPVLGTVAPARAGLLGVLLGGPADAVADAEKLTRLWADQDRIHRYPSAAQAAAAKLAVNLGLAVATQGLGEALQLGLSAGLSIDELLRVLDKTPLGGVTAAKGETIRTETFAADSQFTVDALFKDAALMIALSDIRLPALEVAANSLAAARAAGLGQEDFSVIASPRLAWRPTGRRHPTATHDPLKDR